MAAKHRLLEHVKGMCAAQDRAAASAPSSSEAGMGGNATTEAPSRHSLHSRYNGGGAKKSRGILYTGNPEHLKNIFQVRHPCAMLVHHLFLTLHV